MDSAECQGPERQEHNNNKKTTPNQLCLTEAGRTAAISLHVSAKSHQPHKNTKRGLSCQEGILGTGAGVTPHHNSDGQKILEAAKSHLWGSISGVLQIHTNCRSTVLQLQGMKNLFCVSQTATALTSVHRFLSSHCLSSPLFPRKHLQNSFRRTNSSFWPFEKTQAGQYCLGIAEVTPGMRSCRERWEGRFGEQGFPRSDAGVEAKGCQHPGKQLAESDSPAGG